MDHYTVHLVNHLADLGLDFDLFTLAPHHFSRVPRERIVRPFPSGGGCAPPAPAGNVSGPSLRSRLARSFGDPVKFAWTQFVFPLRLRGKYDLVFSPSQMDALPFPPVPQVVTVLDLIPFILTGQEHKHPFYLRNVFPSALRRSARIIAISESTKNDLVRIFKVPPEKISTVLLARPGFDSTAKSGGDDVRARYKLDRYVLCVSGNHPHKNLPRLIEAFGSLRGREGLKLVIAGFQEPGPQADLERRVGESGLSGRVRFLGHVPDADLPGLYAGAEVFVFPSLYEGFGLPPLEAMAYGAPVAVSRSSSLPEVVGDAGLYFDPLNPEEMAARIGQLLDDAELRGRLRRQGPERAARFSWRKTAEETLKVFQRAVPGPSA